MDAIQSDQSSDDLDSSSESAHSPREALPSKIKDKNFKTSQKELIKHTESCGSKLKAKQNDKMNWAWVTR